MKSVWVRAPFEFELREEPLPTVGPDDVLVQVAYCGICGSDVSMARWSAKKWTPLGHEVSGIVKDIGSAVRHVKVGDRVALDCGNTCGICPECRAGRPKRCTSVRGFYAQRSGMSEYLLAAAQNVYPIGQLDLKLACLAEPFGVAMHLFMSLEIDFLDDVLLIGPGPIGLLALAACKARGARSLTAAGRTAGTRLDFAKSLGAETAVMQGEPSEFFKRPFPGALPGAGGFDKIILTAPPQLLPAAIAACRPGGIIAYCGLETPDTGSVPVSWSAIHSKNIHIRPMGELPHHMPQALELLRRGLIDPRRFITQEFERDEIAQAFRHIEQQPGDVVKAVIRVGPAVS